jgi:hypothetical protein
LQFAKLISPFLLILLFLLGRRYVVTLIIVFVV